LERLAARAPVHWHIATVQELVAETATATTIVLDVPGWPGHVAGQHVDVRLTADDGYQAARSYSIASSPLDARVALTIERIEDGEVSMYLIDELRAGDPLELRGPIGGYFTWQPADGGPLLLLAAGSGLVPLMAMLRHRTDARSTVEGHLLVSARTWPDVLYRDELAIVAARGAEVRYTLTRDCPASWSGWSGRVNVDMLREINFDPSCDPRIFVCGATGFVEHVAELLIALGHDPHAVKTERFGPTGS
jgi:ferredoxin-NADP reductase